MLFRVEVVGSNPAGPTTRPTGPIKAKIFKTLWTLKKSGHSEDTLKAKGHRLRYLAKRVDLDDPEAVKGYIASQSRWSNAYKQGVAYAYRAREFCRSTYYIFELSEVGLLGRISPIFQQFLDD